MKHLFLYFGAMFIACSTQQSVKEQTNKRTIEATVKQEEAETFQDFYVLFRKAVLDSNQTLLIKYTHFPLKIHGFEDHDPVFEIDPTRFMDAFNESVDYSVSYDTENETIITTRDIIVKTEKTNNIPYFDPSEDQIDIGNLQFQRINGKWKLVLLYLNSKEFKK